VGDHIELMEPSSPESSIGGRVIDMNLMFATIEQQDAQGTISTVHIPNNLFFQKLVRTRGPETVQKRPFFNSHEPPAPS
jgi:small-conductance mechanosensitive channel